MAALLVALTVVLTAVPFLEVSGVSGAGFTPARSAGFNSGGFPQWYQDVNGVRVVPCLDPAETHCLAPLANPGIYDPALPLSFPSNYPDEAFYFAADAAPTASVADCPVTPGDGLTVHLALEAAFGGGDPAPGDQMVFGRIRFNAVGNTGLCGNTWYTFRTPYGPYTIKTPADAQIKGGFASANTTDIGCLPTPATPCDFEAVFNAPVLGVGMLRLATGAVAGYLGESTTFGPVVGGKDGFNALQIVRWPAGVTPTQSGFGADCLVAGCTIKATQQNWNVLAKLAGPLAANADALDFGGVNVGASATRDITITNLGSGPLGLDPTLLAAPVITGLGAGEYAVALGDCSDTTALARDGSCTLQVTYSPTAVGAAPAATLEVAAATGGTPVKVTLSGTGTEVTQFPIIGVTPGAVDFGQVRYRTASAIHEVTVSNTGTAPLQVQHVISNAGSWATDFSIASSTCPTGVVNPGGTCVVGVKLVPTHTGSAAADLVITSNDSANPSVTVPLTATVWGGVADVSSDRINGFPTWYQDERGVRVGQCADPANALCITAPIAGPLSFPDNYPDEAFWYLATSDDVVVADSACDAGSGVLMVEAGVEAAFITPSVQDGQQMSFGRIRFVAGRKGGLCPNTSYEVVYPYGKDIITTDADGAVKPSPGTSDVGCAAAPCDFTMALSSPVLEGFLEQAGHPAGYLGNPTLFNTVTGAPYTDTYTGQPANYVTVRRVDNGTVLGTTNRFAVSGRLAGPVVASPAMLDLGTVLASSGTATASTTLTNVGPTAVTLDGSPFSVSGTGDFTVDPSSTCVGGFVLAPNSGSACTVIVAFDPSSTGQRAADLVVNHDGLNDPLAVSLTGVGAADPLQAAMSTSPSALVFTDRSIATVSETQVVTVSNLGGQAPLEVGVPTVDSAQYDVVSNCTAPVDPDLSCTVEVRFSPDTVGSFPATLTIPSNAGPATVVLSGDAVDVDPAVSAALNEAGLPRWVGDDSGVRLQQCLAPQHCIVLADAFYDPANPLVFPTNYPGESFYFIADSELVTVPAHVCPDLSDAPGGTAFLRVATEASFAGGPVAGTPATFNRIRVIADGLCANTTYHFVQPYGTTLITTDGEGVVKQTFDVPNLAGNEPLLSGFLRWDPNVAPAAPAGFLGDGTSFHRVVGSNYRPTGAAEPANYFAVQFPDGTEVARTDKFAVAGQLAGPVVTDASTLDFGVVRQGQVSAEQQVVVSNIGKSPVSSVAATVQGADAGLFTTTTDCTGATLAKDQHCTVWLTLAPGASAPTGMKSATLVITYSGGSAAVEVALAGKVISSAQPALSVTPTSLSFATQTVGTSSATQTITIRNTGTADMAVPALSISGTGASNFQFGTVLGTACPTNVLAADLMLAPNAACTATVRFTPVSIGTKTASIVVQASDPAGPIALAPVTVTLTGSGAQGTVSLSATTLAISGRAGRTATGSVKITNTGTANFSLTSTQVNITLNITATNLRVTGNTCSNVAPRKTCQVTVSFTPGAGAIGETFSADIYLRGNVSNTVLLPGTGAVNGVKFRVNATRSR